MTTDIRALCDELAEALCGYEVTGEDVALISRARAALAAEPEPPVNCPGCEGVPAPGNQPCAVCGREASPPSPSDAEVADPVIPGEYRGFNAIAYRNGFHAGYKHALSRAALVPQPVPEGPTDEHIPRLARDEFISDFARTVLARWGQS